MALIRHRRVLTHSGFRFFWSIHLSIHLFKGDISAEFDLPCIPFEVQTGYFDGKRNTIDSKPIAANTAGITDWTTFENHSHSVHVSLQKIKISIKGKFSLGISPKYS